MTKRPKPKKVKLPANDLVPIVADGSIGGPVAEGRLIPLVILDTSERLDVGEMIRVHRHLTPGDLLFNWALVEDKPDDILLLLEFQRPIETRVILRFSIEQQGWLVDMALEAGGLYLQAGKPGDRLKDDIDRPKIVVDVADSTFRAVWQTVFLERMTALISAQMGLTVRQATPYAHRFIKELRSFGSLRIPRP
jgi:hypothetical protein